MNRSTETTNPYSSPSNAIVGRSTTTIAWDALTGLLATIIALIAMSLIAVLAGQTSVVLPLDVGDLERGNLLPLLLSSEFWKCVPTVPSIQGVIDFRALGFVLAWTVSTGVVLFRLGVRLLGPFSVVVLAGAPIGYGAGFLVLNLTQQPPSEMGLCWSFMIVSVLYCAVVSAALSLLACLYSTNDRLISHE